MKIKKFFCVLLCCISLFAFMVIPANATEEIIDPSFETTNFSIDGTSWYFENLIIPQQASIYNFDFSVSYNGTNYMHCSQLLIGGHYQDGIVERVPLITITHNGVNYSLGNVHPLSIIIHDTSELDSLSISRLLSFITLNLNYDAYQFNYLNTNTDSFDIFLQRTLAAQSSLYTTLNNKIIDVEYDAFYRGVESTDREYIYNEGYNAGYNVGYNSGIDVGQSQKSVGDSIVDFLTAPQRMLNNLVLFSSNGVTVTMWGVLSTLVGISLFIWFLKMFAGG